MYLTKIRLWKDSCKSVGEINSQIHIQRSYKVFNSVKDLETHSLGEIELRSDVMSSEVGSILERRMENRDKVC